MDDTGLRVFWNGDFRIYNCDLCCKRWYFTFNGAECTTPGTIEGLLYLWKGKDVENIHRIRHIEGVCMNVAKGQVTVVTVTAKVMETLMPSLAGIHLPESMWRKYHHRRLSLSEEFTPVSSSFMKDLSA